MPEGPEYEGATPIPATSTNTVEGVDPSPVPHSVTQSPACAGVVRPTVRGVVLQTCATAAPYPAAALVKMPTPEAAIHTVVEKLFPLAATASTSAWPRGVSDGTSAVN